MIIHNDLVQGSADWHQVRLGIPTGSKFKDLITSTGAPSKSMATYAANLAGDLYAGKSLDSFEGNQWTDRGTELEAEARALYQFDTGNDVVEVGFITPDSGLYGVSPDGLIGDDGLVEFKCLKTSNHIAALIYYNKHKKSPTTYIQQVQGQMMVAEREWCDLVFYHPDLPMLVIRNEPDQKIYDGLINQLETVITERDKILEVIKGY